MNYYIEHEVPEHWNGIIESFVAMAQWEAEFNKGVPIDCVEFRVKRGILKITYEGGNHITDAYARFASNMSGTVCYSCGVPSTRTVFNYRKCEDCD
jgi:hypothetical protein